MGIYKDKGIYCIKNIQNNKMYIGYASESLGDRKDSHFSCLRNCYHFNKKLQEDFNIYGEKSFSFLPIEVIDSKDEEVFKERERYYIRLYDTINNGYNISSGGHGEGLRPNIDRIKEMAKTNRNANIGKKVTEETKENMRKSKKRNSFREYGENKSTILRPDDVKSIKIRLMNGESVNVLAREYDVSFSCISSINVNRNWRSVNVSGWEQYILSRGI